MADFPAMNKCLGQTAATGVGKAFSEQEVANAVSVAGFNIRSIAFSLQHRWCRKQARM